MGGNSSSAQASPQASFQLEAAQNPLLLPRPLPAHTPLLIFGDSWAEDNSRTRTGPLAGVEGWPQQLGPHLGLAVEGNFARGQTASSSLMDQLKAAKVALADRPAVWSECLVILHSGGNDFIGAEKKYNPFAKDNFWIPHCTWGFKKKALEVVSNLQCFLTALADLGCRRFLVSDLPFTSKVPALQVARLGHVNKRGQWLSHQMEKMLKEFQDVRSSLQAKGLEVEVGHVREPEILNCLVGSTFGCCFSCNLFVSDLFHPNQELHGHIAEAVASLLKVERCSDQACKKVGYAGETCFELNNTQSPEKAQSTASTTTS